MNFPSFKNQHQYVGLRVKHTNNVELIYDAELRNLNYVFKSKVFVTTVNPRDLHAMQDGDKLHRFAYQ